MNDEVARQLFEKFDRLIEVVSELVKEVRQLTPQPAPASLGEKIDKLDEDFPWSLVAPRLCSFMQTNETGRPKSFRHLIQLGRVSISRMPGITEVFLEQLDRVMQMNGLRQEWQRS